ncbi:MAG: hypothetical protein SFU56_08190 [Capsulimonadales bacterium]|nr:hypothetical protein [Capsulimonadales bacterium]
MALTLSEPTLPRLTEAAAQYGMDAEERLIALPDQQDAAFPPTEETHAAIADGVAELDAGQGRPLDEYVAEQRAKWAAQKP